MCTLWFITIAVVLTAMLPSSAVVSGCNVADCEKRGGKCLLHRCRSTGCNCTRDEVCLDGKCMESINNCGIVLEGTYNYCYRRGVPCGEGHCISVLGLNYKCVNNTCRNTGSCYGEKDGAVCDYLYGYNCHGGVCRVPCDGDDKKGVCGGYPCIHGYCSEPKCGDLICVL